MSSPLSEFDNQRVTDHWSTTRPYLVGATDAHNWLQLPSVQERINRLVTGSPSQSWVDWAFATAFGSRLPVDRCVALACGEGGRIRQLVQHGRTKSVDAFDIAPGAIERARAAANAEGLDAIRFEVADANTLSLDAGVYDCAFIESGLHHFANLEGIYAELRRALKPDGALIFNDYVGARHFQFPARQIRQMNAALQTLPLNLRALPTVTAPADPSRVADRSISAISSPSKLRRLTSMIGMVAARIQDGSLPASVRRVVRRRLSGRYQWEISRPSRAGVVATDPSEAIRSHEILPVLARDFDIVEQRGFGGGILHWMLSGIAANFTGAAGEAALQRVCDIEDSLMARGELGHDFVVVIAIPKPQSPE